MTRVHERPPGQGKKGSKVRRALRRRDGDNCWICGIPMDFSAPAGRTPLSVTRDHVIERGKGGRNTMANQRLAHAKCNNERSVPYAGGFRKQIIFRWKIKSIEIIILQRKKIK